MPSPFESVCCFERVKQARQKHSGFPRRLFLGSLLSLYFAIFWIMNEKRANSLFPILEMDRSSIYMGVQITRVLSLEQLLRSSLYLFR